MSGIKNFIRRRTIQHTASCSSSVQAQRLCDTVKAHQHCHNVKYTPPRTISFTRKTLCVGNWRSDDAQFKSKIAKRANVLVDWTSDLPKDDSEIERPLNQIIAAVEKSARRPAKIEGCPRFPARKTVDILRSMGYDVVSG